MMLVMTLTRAVCVCEHARREAGLVWCALNRVWGCACREDGLTSVSGFWRVWGQEQATGESTSSSNSVIVSSLDTRIQNFLWNGDISSLHIAS